MVVTAAFCRGAALAGGKKEKRTTLSFSKMQQNIEFNTLLSVDSHSKLKKLLKEMKRNFLSPGAFAGMMSHPPIPINELAEHIELLKANDNLRLSQEYEVRRI